MKKQLSLFGLLFCLLSIQLFASTTGKISGIVKDAETGEPLPGANIIVEGSVLGASADVDGYFVILNVPPGSYTVRANMIGYRDVLMTAVRVKINQSTQIEYGLQASVVQSGSAVNVVAERPVIERDVAASTSNITSGQIDALPVQSVADVVGLEAGSLGLSIRGGDSNELGFQVDGFSLRDERNNAPITGISLSAVEEINIQTGGFNAEYGNIQSGVVTVLTKEGDKQKYSGTLTYRYSAPSDKHFGASFNDPNTYWLRPYLDPEVAFVGTANGGWDVNEQSQYFSFNGWNSVAASTLTNEDPSDDLTPQAAQRLFAWEHRRQLDIVEDDYIIDAGFGGPVPGISEQLGNLRFYASYRGEKEMFMVPLSRDAYREDNFLLKMTSNISNTMKLTASGFYNKVESVASNDVGDPGFFRSTEGIANFLTRVGFTTPSRLFYDSYRALTDVRWLSYSLKLNHTISSKAFYEAKLEHTRTKYDTRPNRLRDKTRSFEIVPGFFVDEAPFGTEPSISNGIDGMLMGVGANAFDSTTFATTTLRLDYSNQASRNHLFKTGLELVYNSFNMHFGARNNALPTGRPITQYKRSPLRAAVYIQDKIEFKGLIANLGVRMDYLDPSGDWFDVNLYQEDFYSSNFDPDADTEIARVATDKQLFLSPRLGISHPITESAKLFFNYGHFRQMPEMENLYDVTRVTGNRLSFIGNPNLPLQRTIAYEVGYEHSLYDLYLLRLSAYYRDVSDKPSTIVFQNAKGNVTYSQATANFYQDIRGLEFTFQKRYGRWFTGFMSYTFQVSNNGWFGLRRIFENPTDQKEYLEDNPPRATNQNKTLARPYLRGNLVMQTPRDYGVGLNGFHPFENWQISTLAFWRAGQYFTWTNNISIPGLSDNMQWQDTYNVDLKLSRRFNIKPFSVDLIMDVENLFNFKLWSYLGNGPSGFVDGNDYTSYMRSLRIPSDLADEFNYNPANGFGDDSPGDYRPDDVAFDPLESNPDNDPAITSRNQQRIDKKSYIDNPGMGYLQFLNPRDIYIGMRINFDF